MKIFVMPVSISNNVLPLLKSPERRIEKVKARHVQTLSLKSNIEKGDPPLIDNGWMRNVKQRKDNRKDFSNVLELNENVKVNVNENVM